MLFNRSLWKLALHLVCGLKLKALNSFIIIIIIILISVGIIYWSSKSGEQDVQPRAVIALWKAKIDEPKFHQPDPSLTIYDQSTSKFILIDQVLPKIY